MPQPARLRIELKPSRQLAAVLLVAHALTAAAVLALPVALAVRIALLALIALSLGRCARHPAVSAAPRGCVALEVHRDGSAQWWRAQGMHAGRVLGDSFVSPLLTVVALRRDDDGRRESIVLLPDSAEADALRALRVWLRFKVEIG